MSKSSSAALALIFAFQISVHAYDEVRLDKLVPLVNKNTVPKVMRKDADGHLWIINEENPTLEQIGLDGKATAVILPGKKNEALFKNPVDFGFLSSHAVVVADPGLERLAVIASEDPNNPRPAKMWKKTKLLYTIPMKSPTAVAVSHDDIIAVGNEGQPSIDIYSPDGVLLHRLSASEKYPIKMITALAYAQNGTLWALEDGSGVLHRFSADRKWLGATEGFEGARGLAVDAYGYAYVTLASGRWREVNPDGAMTGTFGAKGKNPGELLNPHGIALVDGVVWISEAGNLRLQSFRVMNKEKKAPLFSEPAAYTHVRFLSQWEDQARSAIMAANGDILLLKAAKNQFEWTDQAGESKSAWKKKGKGTTGFADAVSITTDKDGKVWAVDQGDHSLKAMSETGDVLKTVGQKGKKEGSLKNPNLARVRSDGSFVVVDRDNSRIQVLSPDGLFLFTVGSRGEKPGQFATVSGVAANDAMIAVVDAERKALLFFDSAGKFLNEIANKEGKSPFWGMPLDVATDAQGRFYVLDNGSKRVRIFNAKSQFLADFAAKGTHLVCGPDNHVLVLDEKSVAIYSVKFVPKKLANVAAAESDGDIRLTWEGSPEAASYAIYRSSAANSYEAVGKSDVSPFVDNNFKPAATYTYAVVGMNPDGIGGNWSLSQPVKAPKRKDVSLISIEKIDFKPVFTAAYKFYVTNPIGEITVQNNDEKSFRDVKLSINLKNYSDFPTEVAIDSVGAGESKTVPVTLTLNDHVLELTENTPVQADVRVSYFEENQEKSVTQTAPITLYSRNATAWNDKGRIASFVTPKDPPVLEFARAAIRDHLALLKGSTVGKPLAKAALLYESINALGISYVPDPKTPFSEVSSTPDVLDYVQFPRETLRRRTGDCDDTTALLAALLESIGVSVALVDTPGHIFLMANLEVSDAKTIGLPEERFVDYQGTYWVPVETTKLGHDFMTAWQAGTAEVKAAQEKNQANFIRVSDAMTRYQPVTLVEADKETPAFPSEKVTAAFPPLLKKLQDERYLALMKDVQERIKADPVNHMLMVELGMVQVEGGDAAAGEKTFINLLKEDEPIEVQSAARNNLGNLAYLKGDYKEAVVHYDKALALTPQDGGVMINRARAAWRLGDAETAKKSLTVAREALPDWREFTSDIPAEYLPQ